MLILQLLMFGCNERQLSDSEKFGLYIHTLQGDSTGYRIEYGIAERVDTLYGFYKLSSEYLKLEQQLQFYDSVTFHYMARRDSVFNSRYIDSRNLEHSSYRNWNRHNDSLKAYLKKGVDLRHYLMEQAIPYEKEVRGYLISFNARLVSHRDTLQVHEFDIWLRHTATEKLLQKQIIDGSPQFY
ncbi:hypothetical protein [Pontibacter sp. BAB1700]|uniref:hypothetical protein n=1 Tax=Pontibacter sp. BAB1700 TaxID=1144253 RepID=UPI00026BD12E|nr:hypothetical protein [Pontibacter sp. BAB1700]EJF11927.1 hypothetical protein O71_00230 [Pontibacter sp. BAB1700]